MQIQPSDIIAALALVVSIGSFYYAKAQSASAKNSAINDHRAYLSEHHKKYQTLLVEINDRHRSDLRRLAELASDALTDICNLFDLQNSTKSVRPLRHLLHESSEMIYYSFKGQMSWQTGMNISQRFSYMSDIEDDLHPTSDIFDHHDFRRSIQKMYDRNNNLHYETKLSSDHYFCSLITEMKRRIPREKGDHVLKENQKFLGEFANLLTELRPSFENSYDDLERALEENHLEHFSMNESSRLYENFHRKKAKLNILTHLRLKIIDAEYAEKYENYISIVVHNCTILHAIQDVDSWGWIND